MGIGLLIIQQKLLGAGHNSTMCTRTIIIAVLVLVHYFNASDANHELVKRDDDDSNKDTLEGKILKKLEMLRTIIPTGYAASGIPILDPFYVSNTSIDYENKFIRINCQFENITLSGLRDYKVEKLSIRLLPTQLDFKFTLPDVILEAGRYAIKGKILKFIPIFGNGNIVIRLRNLNIQGLARVSLKEKFLKLTGIELAGDFGKFYFSISGLLKSQLVSKIASVLVTKIVPIVFKDHHEVIWNAIAAYVQEITNSLIQNVTFTRVLDVLDNDNEFLPPSNEIIT